VSYATDCFADTVAATKGEHISFDQIMFHMAIKGQGHTCVATFSKGEGNVGIKFVTERFGADLTVGSANLRGWFVEMKGVADEIGAPCAHCALSYFCVLSGDPRGYLLGAPLLRSVVPQRQPSDTESDVDYKDHGLICSITSPSSTLPS
jgi:hypothetical protein